MEFYTELLDNYKVVKKNILSDDMVKYQHKRTNNTDVIMLVVVSDYVYFNFHADIELLDKEVLYFKNVMGMEYVDFIIKTFLIASNNTGESFVTNSKNYKVTIYSSEILTGINIVGEEYITWKLILKTLPPRFHHFRKNVKEIVFSFYIIDKKPLDFDLHVKIYYDNNTKDDVKLDDVEEILKKV